ncbi:hypothetical protein BU16DRAFT_543446 [Lophium mytilinum]|uniref:Uncharacterized protein n=1 Tax=Lophium mytilinum TaxID=390894 RepID=A0A6A6QGN1_9PEZI|nr:hypothetical protein BU16DRAFT_543446 [Lophium mytilinum]
MAPTRRSKAASKKATSSKKAPPGRVLKTERVTRSQARIPQQAQKLQQALQQEQALLQQRALLLERNLLQQQGFQQDQDFLQRQGLQHQDALDQHSEAKAARTPTTFFSLPRELRDMVYNEVLEDVQFVRPWDAIGCGWKKITPATLLMNKQAHDETKEAQKWRTISCEWEIEREIQPAPEPKDEDADMDSDEEPDHEQSRPHRGGLCLPGYTVMDHQLTPTERHALTHLAKMNIVVDPRGPFGETRSKLFTSVKTCVEVWTKASAEYQWDGRKRQFTLELNDCLGYINKTRRVQLWAQPRINRTFEAEEDLQKLRGVVEIMKTDTRTQWKIVVPEIHHDWHQLYEWDDFEAANASTDNFKLEVIEEGCHECEQAEGRRDWFAESVKAQVRHMRNQTQQAEGDGDEYEQDEDGSASGDHSESEDDDENQDGGSDASEDSSESEDVECTWLAGV